MRRTLALIGTTVATFLLGTFVFWGTGCACDGPDRFAGVNPFRNRAPERATQKFLQAISSGECDVEEEALCRQALANGRVTEWSFTTRETRNGTTILYYDVHYERPLDRHVAVSITVEPTSAGWRISSYTPAQ